MLVQISAQEWDQLLSPAKLGWFVVGTVQGQCTSFFVVPQLQQHRYSRAPLLVLVLYCDLICSWHVEYLQCCGKCYMEIKTLDTGIV